MGHYLQDRTVKSVEFLSEKYGAESFYAKFFTPPTWDGKMAKVAEIMADVINQVVNR